MTTEPSTRFGAEVRERRRRQHLSQSALAAAVGISLHAIHEIETGKTRAPDVMTVLKLCQALAITPNEMAACFAPEGESAANPSARVSP